MAESVTPKMEAEPVLIAPDGTRSDASLHEAMLASPGADALADEAAREVARELGFSEEEIQRMIG